jgi:hypothetical protein
VSKPLTAYADRQRYERGQSKAAARRAAERKARLGKVHMVKAGESLTICGTDYLVAEDGSLRSLNMFRNRELSGRQRRLREKAARRG